MPAWWRYSSAEGLLTTPRSGIENVLPQLLLGHLKRRDLEMPQGKEEFHPRHARKLGRPAGRQLPELEELDGPKHLEVLAERLHIRLQADQRFFRDLQPDCAHELTLRLKSTILKSTIESRPFGLRGKLCTLGLAPTLLY